MEHCEKYKLCTNCGNYTIYNYLPSDIQNIICSYIDDKSINKIKCSQCEFIEKNNVNQFIEKLYPEKYDFYEEHDPQKMIDYLVDNKIIKIFSHDEWNKCNYKILNVTGVSNPNSTLIELEFMNWMDSEKCGLVDKDKKILFEVLFEYNDIYLQIILLLERLSIINYIVMLDTYEENREVFDDKDIDDDFVIYESSLSEDVDYGVDYDYGGDYDF